MAETQAEERKASSTRSPREAIFARGKSPGIQITSIPKQRPPASRKRLWEQYRTPDPNQESMDEGYTTYDLCEHESDDSCGDGDYEDEAGGDVPYEEMQGPIASPQTVRGHSLWRQSDKKSGPRKDQRPSSTAPWDSPHADSFFGQVTADNATRRTRERTSRAMRTGRYPSPPYIGPIVHVGHASGTLSSNPDDFEKTMEEDEPGSPTRRSRPPVRWNRRLGCYAPVECASQTAGTDAGRKRKLDAELEAQDLRLLFEANPDATWDDSPSFALH
ncbi:hypothetical protein Slin15195_G053430 [Septoria linicola]|uniref:Uncharacterized protein n=1 Tax=Septoria linicola TaxID=215465 RepID=A0A9Q9AMH1_9PEZI|nr:hypothetical protein Slin15195_G053430 [Septoria linicola]